MKIECLIRRKNGTTVSFDRPQDGPRATYVFQPEGLKGDGAHVCEVEEPKHIAILLGIKTFQPAAGEKVPGEVVKDIRPAQNNVREVTRDVSGVEDDEVEALDAYDERNPPPDVPQEDILGWDAETMTNAQLSHWASRLGVNPADKASIQEYGLGRYGKSISRRLQPMNMLRELLKLAQAHEQDVLRELDGEAPAAGEPAFGKGDAA